MIELGTLIRSEISEMVLKAILRAFSELGMFWCEVYFVVVLAEGPIIVDKSGPNKGSS